MPNPMIDKVVKKTDLSREEVEKYWSDAKKSAAKSDHKEDYDYIVSIFKKMLGKDNLEKIGWVFESKIFKYLD